MAQQTDGAEAFSLPSIAARTLLILVVIHKEKKMEEILKQYKDLLIQKRYSQNTQDIYELHRPKKEHKLPKMLSKTEVKRIIDVTTNLKHR